MAKHTQLSKLAAADPLAGLDPEDAKRIALVTESAHAITKMLMAGLGVGVLGRVVPAAHRMMSGQVGALSTGRATVSPLDIGKLLEPPKDKEEKVAGIVDKAAAPINLAIAKLLNKLQLEGGLPGDLAGAQSSHWYTNPAIVGLGFPATLGAMGLGYYGADKVVDAFRGNEVNQELEALKDEYKKTLQSRMYAKNASVMEDLDCIAEAATGSHKTAEGGWLDKLKKMLAGMYNFGLGGYTGYAVTAPLVTGLATYKLTKAMGGDEATEKAFKRRIKEQRERGYHRPLQFEVSE